MADLPALILAAGQTHRCLRGHPWVFRSEIAEVVGQVENGEPMEVRDRRGRVVGRGLYSAASQIAVRLLTRNADVALDRAFFTRRLHQALAWRDRCMPGRPARRLVSSEADLLPGLIVDQYGDVLTVQTTTVGMDRRLPMWVELLNEACAPGQIVERNDLAVRQLEGLPSRSGILCGRSTGTMARVTIGRVMVEVDVMDPHKTGSYLDQQLNHEAVAAWIAPGATVLDCFCHLGGFALHALLAGAASAVAVDSAEASIAGAQRTANAAGLADRLTLHHQDAFDWLREAEQNRRRFDVVILDPPSFTRNRHSRDAALRGYRQLHLRGLRLLGVGGRLVSFSCSHHIGAEEFLDTVVDAAAECGRTVRLEHALDASPDHPLLPVVPETRYLKGVVLSVIDS